jgi:hypothetical protein
MTLVTHYNLELHQMDVKTTFLNGDLLENVYMAQHKGFAMKEKEHMGCHLKKSIYGLKQASRQWYLKFDGTIRSFGFKENEEDNYIYTKFRSVTPWCYCSSYSTSTVACTCTYTVVAAVQT